MSGPTKEPGACESLAGKHAPGPARLYVCGWRCAHHTPAAMAGRPEAPPGPGWPAHRNQPTDESTEEDS
jgi:hypothetical protein